MSCDSVVEADTDRRWRKRRDRSFTACISPRLIISRWFNGRNPTDEKHGIGKNRELPRIGGNFGINRSRVKGSMEILDFAAEKSEGVRKEAPFNLGVGFGLMFLIAASRNELKKMVNLHRQMQILLQNFRKEFQNNLEKGQCSDSALASSFPNSDDVQETSCVEKPVSSRYISSHYFESPEVTFISDKNRRQNRRGMDQIGDELEAELDHLQLQMDTEFPSNYSQQQHSEINVEDSAPEMSLTTSFEDYGKQPYQMINSNQDQLYGIDPFELERRLHQVLEARQQEEINELIHQLELKETEVSWWKDTVRLISQHAKEPVRGTDPEF